MANDAMNVLVANHRRFLEFLERRTGNRAEAEDILQAAFLRGIEKSGEIRDDESAVAWFYRLLRNALTDSWRRKDAEARAVAGAARELPGEDAELRNEVCRCIMDLLPTLKREQADLLRHVELDDVPVAEAASRAGITPNNASVRLHRARAALLKAVQQSCRTCATHGCLDCTCGSTV